MRRENTDYWNLAIPGVGAAPIKSYLTLITLFVIVIGPVNYCRAASPPTAVPAVGDGAGRCGPGDGCAARLRAGQRRPGRAGAGPQLSPTSTSVAARRWPGRDSRTTPAWRRPAAWRFPRMWPAIRSSSSPTSTWEHSAVCCGTTSRSCWSGYMASRSTAQFMVVQSRPSTLRAAGVRARAGRRPAPPRVTNGLNTTIEQLALRDTHGKYYRADERPNRARTCRCRPRTRRGCSGSSRDPLAGPTARPSRPAMTRATTPAASASQPLLLR